MNNFFWWFNCLVVIWFTQTPAKREEKVGKRATLVNEIKIELNLEEMKFSDNESDHSCCWDGGKIYTFVTVRSIVKVRSFT